MVDTRGCRLCHQTCWGWGTPWEDIRLLEGANTRHRLRQRKLTRRRGDILAVTEAETLHAHLRT